MGKTTIAMTIPHQWDAVDKQLTYSFTYALGCLKLLQGRKVEYWNTVAKGSADSGAIAKILVYGGSL